MLIATLSSHNKLFVIIQLQRTESAAKSNEVADAF